MKDKKYQIVMISSEDAEIRELGISQGKVIMLSAGIILLSLTLLYFTTDYLTDVFYGKRLTALRGQNEQLVGKISEINERISSLTQQLTAIEDRDDAIRTYADLPAIDKDIRSVGVGGTARGANARLDYLLPSGGHTISDIEFDIDKIERELNLEAKSLEEIYEHFRSEKDLILHTPTILPIHTGYFTSSFGMRDDPFTGKRRAHPGVDVSARRGTPVFATADGVISDARYSPTYGNTVKIDHGYGYQTRFAHLSKITVKKHQKVLRGTKIGEVGNTGRSRASHLHYEVFKNGVREDPMKYFSVYNRNLKWR